MPRLVRRKPLMERLKSMMNPMDFLLYLSEELETRDWDSKPVGTQLGLATNFAFLLARANSARVSRPADPVFDDEAASGYSAWLTFVIGFLVWFLVFFSLSNALYTMRRSRHYRLFESDVEKPIDTPSAHRVRVQSSPASSSSPLRLLADMVSPTDTPESRAHPDKTRDVWELNVWDPLPICLRVFCFFSPGHVLVYLLFLPLAPLDPRPSVSVFNCLVLQAILSAQLLLLQSRFSQQNKDTSIIQREVMHEYDTKFVHPNLYPQVRDASTQLSDHDAAVEVGKPMVQMRRGFRTRPNPNYANHVDPDRLGNSIATSVSSPSIFTPPHQAARHSQGPGDGLVRRDNRTQMRRSTPSRPSLMNPAATSTYASTGTSGNPNPDGTKGNGSYLGLYNHPSSPLKKATSLGDLQYRSPRNNSEMAQLEQYQAQQRRGDRTSSPTKSVRQSTGTAPALEPRAKNPWWDAQPSSSSNERYPRMTGRRN